MTYHYVNRRMISQNKFPTCRVHNTQQRHLLSLLFLSKVQDRQKNRTSLLSGFLVNMVTGDESPCDTSLEHVLHMAVRSVKGWMNALIPPKYKQKQNNTTRHIIGARVLVQKKV